MLIPSWLILVLAFSFTMSYFTIPAYGQEEISVNGTQPCFLNQTASYQIFENCNAQDDYLLWMLSGWEWVSGGYFTMIVISVIILMVYARYKEAIYPVFIGMVYLPFTFFLFPDQFLSWAIIMAFMGVGVWIWYAFVRQT